MNTDKLKTLSQEEKNEIVKQVNSEVTTIAKEEERTGQKINLPQGEQLVMIMANELMRCKREIAALLPTMSKRAIHRATLAYLDLPTDDVPVYLKGDDEKKLFAFGQRAIMARMVVIQHHANKLALEARVKKEQEEKAKQQSEVPDNGPATEQQT
jgi:hypothetical protein